MTTGMPPATLGEGDARYRDQHAGRATALPMLQASRIFAPMLWSALLTRETHPARSGKGDALALWRATAASS